MWKKPQEMRVNIYAPGVDSNAISIDGFNLNEKLDTQCRAFLFVDNRTNEHEMGLPKKEVLEKINTLNGRIPGVVLTTEDLELTNSDVKQLLLDEVENVEKALEEAIRSVMKQATGIVLGLYRTKGGVGIHSIARLLQLHLKENKIEAHTIAREDRFDFQVVAANQFPIKTEQAKELADCVIVCEPTPSTNVDRKILIADQTDVSAEKIRNSGDDYNVIVVNRFLNDVMPKNVYKKSVERDDLLIIEEELAIRDGGMIGHLDEVPRSIRAELQAIYM